MADSLETLIDPFDLDVFTPHLNSNLTRLAQRTSVSHVRNVLGVKARGLRLPRKPASALNTLEVVLGGGQDPNRTV